MARLEPSRSLVLAKCEAFTDFQLWPAHDELDTEGWLSNFDDAEMPYALTLLNHFVYYPRKFAAKLVRHSIHDLSRDVVSRATTQATAKHEWAKFLDAMLITRVTGETPNDTDSAFQIVRLVRQHVEIPEEQIIEPENLVSLLLGLRDRTVVFMDDFVGSGNQLIETWRRPYPTGTRRFSFEEVSRLKLGHRFLYLPIVATSYGIEHIGKEAKAVEVRASHVLGSEYNCLHADCRIWPDHLKPNAVAVLRNASARAGIPDDEWTGFHDLGLAFAFEGSTPDATLPLFHWNRNNWKRLVART
ncbi:MAG: hypothetical protein ABIZ04_09515 [Opitutus sp.]